MFACWLTCLDEGLLFRLLWGEQNEICLIVFACQKIIKRTWSPSALRQRGLLCVNYCKLGPRHSIWKYWGCMLHWRCRVVFCHIYIFIYIYMMHQPDRPTMVFHAFWKAKLQTFVFHFLPQTIHFFLQIFLV